MENAKKAYDGILCALRTRTRVDPSEDLHVQEKESNTGIHEDCRLTGNDVSNTHVSVRSHGIEGTSANMDVPLANDIQNEGGQQGGKEPILRKSCRVKSTPQRYTPLWSGRSQGGTTNRAVSRRRGSGQRLAEQKTVSPKQEGPREARVHTKEGQRSEPRLTPSKGPAMGALMGPRTRGAAKREREMAEDVMAQGEAKVPRRSSRVRKPFKIADPPECHIRVTREKKKKRKGSEAERTPAKRTPAKRARKAPEWNAVLERVFKTGATERRVRRERRQGCTRGGANFPSTSC